MCFYSVKKKNVYPISSVQYPAGITKSVVMDNGVHFAHNLFQTIKMFI